MEVNGRQVVDQLGVEGLEDQNGCEVLKRNEPFGETNVKGVLAAGDIGTMMKLVTQAMYMGTVAGAGLHMQLVQEEEIGIAEMPEMGRSE